MFWNSEEKNQAGIQPSGKALIQHADKAKLTFDPWQYKKERERLLLTERSQT